MSERSGIDREIGRRLVKRLALSQQPLASTTTAIPALLPPPFPLTPFVLTCGALRVNPWRFFTVFGAMRLVRFGTEAALALVFGRKIMQILRSDTFQLVIVGFIVLAVVGTIISAVLLWRSTRRQEVRT